MKKGMAIAMVLTAACAFSTIQAFGSGTSESAEQLFRTKCSKCHSEEMPLHINKDLKGWQDTVKKMQAKDPTWISNKEAKEITEFLATRSKSQSK